MTRGEESKRKIVTCAAKLFWKKGYATTGMSEIVKASGLPKGSLYFYFSSKKDIAIAVISYYEKVVTEALKTLSEKCTWKEFVTQFTSYMYQAAIDDTNYGCPFAVLGMELAFNEPEITAQYFQSLNRLKEIFRDSLVRSGIPQADSEDLSRQIFSLYEGELLMYRVSKDVKYFQYLQKDLLYLFEAYQKDHR